VAVLTGGCRKKPPKHETIWGSAASGALRDIEQYSAKGSVVKARGDGRNTAALPAAQGLRVVMSKASDERFITGSHGQALMASAPCR